MKVAMYLAAKQRAQRERQRALTDGTAAPASNQALSSAQMRELIGCDSPLDPRGNPQFTNNIYKCMEREFETKKRFCK